MALSMLGQAALGEKRLDEAAANLREALRIAGPRGSGTSGLEEAWLAQVALARGDRDSLREARGLLEQRAADPSLILSARFEICSTAARVAVALQDRAAAAIWHVSRSISPMPITRVWRSTRGWGSFTSTRRRGRGSTTSQALPGLHARVALLQNGSSSIDESGPGAPLPAVRHRRTCFYDAIAPAWCTHRSPALKACEAAPRGGSHMIGVIVPSLNWAAAAGEERSQAPRSSGDPDDRLRTGTRRGGSQTRLFRRRKASEPARGRLWPALAMGAAGGGRRPRRLA